MGRMYSRQGAALCCVVHKAGVEQGHTAARLVISCLSLCAARSVAQKICVSTLAPHPEAMEATQIAAYKQLSSHSKGPGVPSHSACRLTPVKPSEPALPVCSQAPWP